VLLNPLVALRPTHRGLVERFGKYNRFYQPGLHIRIPAVDRVVRINITEQMVDAGKQEIITNDNLNATVDAQVYFKVKDDEASVKASQYNVNDHQVQIVSLARTTLRNIIGTLTLRKANSERNTINNALYSTLLTETAKWGIEIVRTELKEINPPQDVQETMNKVVKAENEKMAAGDFATAVETQADGKRRAAIKEAEGVRQATILEAEGKAKAIETVNKAADEFFVGNAQLLKKLEVAQACLQSNAKIVVPEGSSLVNLIGKLTD
jgi:regulator of protease activity HflC (stomatin/prohibitin superfamily)